VGVNRRSEDTPPEQNIANTFGCCDKDLAARLIARAYPKKTVRIEE
jgi:hypothetical protein